MCASGRLGGERFWDEDFGGVSKWRETAICSQRPGVVCVVVLKSVEEENVDSRGERQDKEDEKDMELGVSEQEPTEAVTDPRKQ